MYSASVVLRANVPWMTIREAIYDAVRRQEPPMLVRQRSNGQIRVRETHGGLCPVRIDIEFFPEGAGQTVVELRDVTSGRARLLPGAGARRRAVVEAIRSRIESAVALHQRGRVESLGPDSLQGLTPLSAEEQTSHERKHPHIFRE